MSGMIGALFGSVLEGAGKGMVAAADTQIQRDNAKIAADQKIAMEERLMAAKLMMEEQAAARAAARVSSITSKKVSETKLAGPGVAEDGTLTVDGAGLDGQTKTVERDQTTKEKIAALTNAGMVGEAEKLQRIANGEAVEKYHNDLVDVRKAGVEQKDRSMQAKAELDRERTAAIRSKYFDENGKARPSAGLEIAKINSYNQDLTRANGLIIKERENIAKNNYFGPALDEAKARVAALEQRIEETTQKRDDAIVLNTMLEINRPVGPASKAGSGMVTAPPVVLSKNATNSMTGKIKKSDPPKSDSPKGASDNFKSSRDQVNSLGK